MALRARPTGRWVGVGIRRCAGCVEGAGGGAAAVEDVPAATRMSRRAVCRAFIIADGTSRLGI